MHPVYKKKKKKSRKKITAVEEILVANRSKEYSIKNNIKSA
jgi:hypothetical protein